MGRIARWLIGTALVAGPTLAQAQELTVWDWKSGDPVAANYFAAAKTAFEAAHPGVTVNFVMQPHDQYYTLLGTALGSESGPDVMLLHGGAQATSRAAALKPLNDMTEGLAGVADFTADGNAIALPLTIQGFVVYYNKALYEAAGLDPDAPPRTWDELKSVCEAFKTQGEVPCFAMGNKEGFGGDFFLSVLAADMFTPEQQAQMAAGDLPWTDPALRTIVETWVQTSQDGWYPEGANAMAKFMDEYETFMRGEAANTIGLLSDVAHWKQFEEFLGPDALGVYLHPAPGGEPRLPVSGGIGYAVNANSANADLAAELVKVLSAPEQAAIFAVDTGALPANTAVDTSALSSPTLTTILGMLDGPTAPLAHAVMAPTVMEEWHRQSQLLLNGETTVDDALARMEEIRQQAKSN
ncbi:ABC transporter substrate-binding protein [Rubellimicrobium arenae]|uniref:ABC transporter substrate-binding protein n=1 Tax=Rubellimicrobium arenae TaxID=2817372 RepID=UPI001B31671E|nr:extracellular solute-binding protein [Rubellimicrobium arenae]